MKIKPFCPKGQNFSTKKLLWPDKERESSVQVNNKNPKDRTMCSIKKRQKAENCIGKTFTKLHILSVLTNHTKKSI